MFNSEAAKKNREMSRVRWEIISEVLDMHRNGEELPEKLDNLASEHRKLFWENNKKDGK